MPGGNGEFTMSMILTAFERSPDGGKGLARDTRVRWALEEVGQAYEVRLLSFSAMKAPAHLAHQPFGQIPTLEQDGLVLFETGAITRTLPPTLSAAKRARRTCALSPPSGRSMAERRPAATPP